MAKFYANIAGDILRLDGSRLVERSATPPAGTAYTLQFDEETNTGLITAYQSNAAQFRMDGGTLTQNGTPATVNPDGLIYAAFRDRIALLAKARETTDPFTRQEVALILGLAFRANGLD